MTASMHPCQRCGRPTHKAGLCKACRREVGPDAAAVVAAAEAAAYTHVCTQCGAAGPENRQGSVNGLAALVLLLFFIVPGVLYIILASAMKKTVCITCGAKNTMVPRDSPIGRKLAAQV